MEETYIAGAFAKAQEAGLVRIQYEFSGSGDSGDINTRSFYDTDDNEIELEDEVVEFFNDVVDRILGSYYGYDWYNNDGGQGTLVIDIPGKTWQIDGVTYYTESSEACAEGDMDTIIQDLTTS